ncbi:hypothetical protein AAFC00_002860 [Neodothiora populina]
MRPIFARLSPNRSLLRCFSSTRCRWEIRDIAALPDRISPSYQETTHHDLLCLQWPQPPRNVLVVIKDGSPAVRDTMIEYANHINSTYPDVSLILEPHVAREVHEGLEFPVYTTAGVSTPANVRLQDKVDVTCTLGGDGTILHASSLFATARDVPPVLSFSMGTLGFLGEWKFSEHKRAFREVFMSGAAAGYGSSLLQSEGNSEAADKSSVLTGWSSVRGKSMGPSRSSRVLLRNRLKVGIFAADGTPLTHEKPSSHVATRERHTTEEVYAMNEVLLHRGREPHLAIINIYVGGRFLTEAVADGLLISTPTGSTAYSLSSGGSIVHPLVSSLLLTPICARSLSFRPLVLPANTPITLTLSEKNRGDEVEVSVDGVRREKGLTRGMEVRVVGEDIRSDQREWGGGVPSIVRAGNAGGSDGQDHWVGGLNGLLKFNYPFGEDE